MTTGLLATREGAAFIARRIERGMSTIGTGGVEGHALETGAKSHHKGQA